MVRTTINGEISTSNSGWGGLFSNNYKETVSTNHFYWQQTTENSVDVIFLENYPVENKKGYFVKILTSDTPSTDVIRLSKELKEFRPFPKNHYISLQTVEEITEVLKNKTLTSFEDITEAVQIPIEPLFDKNGNIVSEGDYLWVWINLNSEDRETYLDIVFVDTILPKSRVLAKKPNVVKGEQWNLNKATKWYQKFPETHPITNMPYDWAREIMLGKKFPEGTDLDTILDD